MCLCTLCHDVIQTSGSLDGPICFKIPTLKAALHPEPSQEPPGLSMVTLLKYSSCLTCIRKRPNKTKAKLLVTQIVDIFSLKYIATDHTPLQTSFCHFNRTCTFLRVHFHWSQTRWARSSLINGTSLRSSGSTSSSSSYYSSTSSIKQRAFLILFFVASIANIPLLKSNKAAWQDAVCAAGAPGKSHLAPLGGWRWFRGPICDGCGNSWGVPFSCGVQLLCSHLRCVQRGTLRRSWEELRGSNYYNASMKKNSLATSAPRASDDSLPRSRSQLSDAPGLQTKALAARRVHFALTETQSSTVVVSWWRALSVQNPEGIDFLLLWVIKGFLLVSVMGLNYTAVNLQMKACVAPYPFALHVDWCWACLVDVQRKRKKSCDERRNRIRLSQCSHPPPPPHCRSYSNWAICEQIWVMAPMVKIKHPQYSDNCRGTTASQRVAPFEPLPKLRLE